MIRIDLEKLAEFKEIKHVDYILIHKNITILIEETSRAKSDDIKKIESTIQALKQGLLSNYLTKHGLNLGSHIISIIHTARRPSTMEYKMMHSVKIPIYIVACKRELNQKTK